MDDNEVLGAVKVDRDTYTPKKSGKQKNRHQEAESSVSTYATVLVSTPRSGQVHQNRGADCRVHSKPKEGHVKTVAATKDPETAQDAKAGAGAEVGAEAEAGAEAGDEGDEEDVVDVTNDEAAPVDASVKEEETTEQDPTEADSPKCDPPESESESEAPEADKDLRMQVV